MKTPKRPVLSDWTIIRTNLVGQVRPIRYHFTGIVQGHPHLPDNAQIVTTEVQEIGKDGRWGRTRSRIYSLRHHLSRSEFTPELAFEVRVILRSELSRRYDIEGISIEVEWISIADSRALISAEGSDLRTCNTPSDIKSKVNQEPVALETDQEVEAILNVARKKGEILCKTIIDEAGGLLTTREAAKAAGLSSQALRRRMNKSLLAVENAGSIGWPRFQFESPEIMKGIGEVMKRLDIESPWMKLNFFLMHLDELGGVRPIDAIKARNIRAAEIAASHFGTHGAS